MIVYLDVGGSPTDLCKMKLMIIEGESTHFKKPPGALYPRTPSPVNSFGVSTTAGVGSAAAATSSVVAGVSTTGSVAAGTTGSSTFVSGTVSSTATGVVSTGLVISDMMMGGCVRWVSKRVM